MMFVPQIYEIICIIYYMYLCYFYDVNQIDYEYYE